MQDLPEKQWSFVSHLQTNKAKLGARFATGLQAPDSLHLAEALERRLQAEVRGLDVCLCRSAPWPKPLNTACLPTRLPPFCARCPLSLRCACADC